ncbi:MAG: GNAT family N-acetyltransferase [Oscillibacter sp.]|nr:GNAT family N-acetyltransferase [Oscillibacter sp.]
MTTIYLIRHAEAEGNLYRIVQGQRDSTLTDRGWRQVRALETRFEGVPIDAVYSSDLYRARATATAISRPRGLSVRGVPDLREIRVGEWEELTFGEIAYRDPVMLENFGRHMDLWHVPGAESPREALDRAWKFLNRVAAEHDGQTIAVVSHGYILRLLLSKIEGMTLEQTGSVPHGDNTAVSLLEYDNGAFRLLFRDDNRHLQTEAYLQQETSGKRKNALETGLRFRELPPDDPLSAELGAEAFDSVGRPFRRERYVSDAETRTTLAAYLGERTAGLAQIGPEPGQISILYLRDAYRRKGMGVQLIGQAVIRARARGGTHVRTAAPPERAPFFRACGFAPIGPAENGYTLWEKDIRFPKLDAGPDHD